MSERIDVLADTTIASAVANAVRGERAALTRRLADDHDGQLPAGLVVHDAILKPSRDRRQVGGPHLRRAAGPARRRFRKR